MKLCVIPARGGSKRIPGKNIRLFAGKPIISYSIVAALESDCFDDVIVSTDDNEIASIAKFYGAEVPFIRPVELSDDYTGTSAVIAHAIQWYKKHKEMPDEVCCLYATAPFICASDIKDGLRILIDTASDYAFSVTSFAFPIQRAIRINESDRVEMFSPEHFNTRSQDLEEAFHDAGQFYWGKTNAWLAGTPIFSARSSPVILPRYRVQDIDTLEDWKRAELMFHAMQEWRRACPFVK